MKRWALLCGVMLLFAGVASAQESPKAEVFGGYSYARLSANGLGVNLNGGSASVSYNPNAWLGLVGDFGGYHGGANFGNGNVYTYLFGPKVAFRRGPITPFVQTLFGGAHASVSGGCVGARVRPQVGCISASENSFATTLGGGLDWNATPHLGVRLIQAEYFMTRFASTTENGARISAGVVFRW
ncbi:MAG TPA: outer membrane beta-barrel protein [Candidatus Acidoferrales bacterium]|nr:outer membrane beta-barrel protein [Candidatus Acidoferrales bacterium]